MTTSMETAVQRKVYFISQSEAEKTPPVPGSAMISITDPDKPLAKLGSWDSLYRDCFYDGGYSEDVICSMKVGFRRRFSSYIDSDQARNLAAHLDQLASTGVAEVYVHCHRGVSRSGAIAKYLHDKHGYSVNKPIESPNGTVYELLNDPDKYEALIQRFEADLVDSPAKLSPLSWVWKEVLSIFGIERDQQ